MKVNLKETIKINENDKNQTEKLNFDNLEDNKTK